MVVQSDFDIIVSAVEYNWSVLSEDFAFMFINFSGYLLICTSSDKFFCNTSQNEKSILAFLVGLKIPEVL